MTFKLQTEEKNSNKDEKMIDKNYHKKATKRQKKSQKRGTRECLKTMTFTINVREGSSGGEEWKLREEKNCKRHLKRMQENNNTPGEGESRVCV